MKTLLLLLCASCQAMTVSGYDTAYITGRLGVGNLVCLDNSITYIYDLTGYGQILSLTATGNSSVFFDVPELEFTGATLQGVCFNGQAFSIRTDAETFAHVTQIPEPATALLLAIGAACAVGTRKKEDEPEIDEGCQDLSIYDLALKIERGNELAAKMRVEAWKIQKKRVRYGMLLPKNREVSKTYCGSVPYNAKICKKGHTMTEDNTIYTRAGNKYCRTCNREYIRAFRRKHKVGFAIG